MNGLHNSLLGIEAYLNVGVEHRQSRLNKSIGCLFAIGDAQSFSPHQRPVFLIFA